MTFGNSFKLQDFPFDQQSLGIQAVSYSFNQNLMNLTFYDDASGGPAFPPVSQTFSSVLWNLQGTTNNATTIVFREGQPLYSLLQFNLQVKRDPTIYILNYILPLFFISFSSCLTYWVDPKIAPARVSFAISLLLSTIAFIFIVSAQLPKVNYPTKLDIYIMMCFGFIFTSLVEFATVHALNRYGYVVLQDSIELTFRFMTPILLILVTGAVFSGSNLVVDGGRVALAVLAAFVICIGISYIVFRVRRDHMKRKKAAAEESAQDDDANNKTAVDGAMFHAVLPA